MQSECLACGMKEEGATFIGKFCSLTCRWIWHHRRRLGYYVRKG